MNASYWTGTSLVHPSSHVGITRGSRGDHLGIKQGQLNNHVMSVAHKSQSIRLVDKSLENYQVYNLFPPTTPLWGRASPYNPVIQWSHVAKDLF
ncbi:MAG: hypothetical protein CVU48_06735 [Candidatus Cloacimonetes bacterium HGW-Cloacimonetes-1]|nr:MAG: hypothetical protein CVU48_06735 [Candidatus Cloacimonetes bacterium HGW-Cloacimonetes-1]